MIAMSETASATDTAPVRLSPGDPAPDFTLPDADGNQVALSSYRGRRVIVYCYPAALTPGCTTQAVDFTEAAGDLAQAGEQLDHLGGHERSQHRGGRAQHPCRRAVGH